MIELWEMIPEATLWPFTLFPSWMNKIFFVIGLGTIFKTWLFMGIKLVCQHEDHKRKERNLW